jgi:hypothetical protein
MYAIAGQGSHIQRVSESWASAICFHETPLGGQIMLMEKNLRRQSFRDIARENCPRHVIAAPFA